MRPSQTLTASTQRRGGHATSASSPPAEAETLRALQTSTKFSGSAFVYVHWCLWECVSAYFKRQITQMQREDGGDLSRNVLLSEKFSASACVCARLCVCVCPHVSARLWGEKRMICMYAFVFRSAKMYAVKGLKVVFSQTLAICSAKQ